MTDEEFTDLLGKARIVFWACLNTDHKAVTWTGDVAACDTCGLTSAITRQWMAEVRADERARIASSLRENAARFRSMAKDQPTIGAGWQCPARRPWRWKRSLLPWRGPARTPRRPTVRTLPREIIEAAASASCVHMETCGEPRLEDCRTCVAALDRASRAVHGALPLISQAVAEQARTEERAAILAMIRHYFSPVEDDLWGDVQTLCGRIERGNHLPSRDKESPDA